MKISKEIKIGTTAILSVAIIYAGIIFLKGLKLFSNEVSYFVEMTDVQGMPVASEVLANGLKVGSVKAITYDQNAQKILVEINVNPDFFIPQGTTAYLTKEMLGAAKMNLRLGPDPSNNMKPGDTFKGESGLDLMSAAGNMMPQVEALLPKMDSILTALNALANDPSLASSLHNLEYVTEDLKTTTKSVNALLGKDVPVLLAKAEKIGSNLEATTSNLNNIDMAGIASKADKTLANVQDMTFKFNTAMNSKDNTLGMLMNDNSIMLHLDSTLQNSSLLLEDMRNHPKRYVHFSVFGKKDK